MTSAPGKRTIHIDVNERIYQRCSDMAKTANVPTSTYNRMLFEAAYAARCAETGDIDLDTAVSRVALLFGNGFDAQSIRQATGLSETFVGRTVEAWQLEMRRGPSDGSRRVSKRREARD